MKPCGHEVVEDWCRVCFIYQTKPEYKAHWDGSISAPRPKPKLSCAHLGEPTGEVIQCPTCSGTVKLKLIACEVHGKCLPGKIVAGQRSCLNCKDFQPKE